ncbi:MAG: DUF3488 and transglutaminase-like domain-containing protein [Acidobacteriota bacterium]
MTYSRALQLVTYLLLLAGFSAMLAASAVGPGWGAVYLMLIVCTAWLGPLRAGRLWHGLAIAFCLIAFLADWILISGIVAAAVHLLLLLSLYKAVTREKDSDYLALYLMSLGFLLIASTYTLSISYLVFLVLFVFLAVLAFVLFESRRAYRENPRADFSLSSFLQISLIITLLTTVLAVPIFLAVPRTALGWWGSSESRMVGFSDSIRLGEFGRILQNPEVVMRVVVNRPVEQLPPDLKWRGVALNQFDGRAWFNTLQSRQERMADARGRFLVDSRRRQSENLLEQTFYMEPFTNVVFGAPSVIQLSGFSGRVSHVTVDGNRAISVHPRPLEPIRYFIHSDLRDRADVIRAIDRDGSIPGHIAESFLELPELDPRIAQLTAALTDEAPTPLERALSIEAYLKGPQFHYSLRDPSGSSPDPLADFLFTTREGHCEYFATAMAVMLRIAGIPSRIVNGFRRGEFNPWGGYLIVRESDAHSWVEAYFPGGGWLEFDPTPTRLSVRSGFLLQIADQFLDSLNVFWAEVVTFDRIKQLGFFFRVRSALVSGWRGAWDRLSGLDGFGWADSGRAGLPGRLLGPVMTLGVLVAGFVVFRERRRLRLLWRRRVKGRSPDVTCGYYEELMLILERRGFKKSRFETPLEFSKRVSEQLETDLPVAITETYYRARFGAHETTIEDLDRLRTSLRQLRAIRV